MEKCVLCGMDEIPELYRTCKVCGWCEDGSEQEPDDDFDGGGPNRISFNQYKSIWNRHKQRIMNDDNGKWHLVLKIFEEEGGKLHHPTAEEIIEMKKNVEQQLAGYKDPTPY